MERIQPVKIIVLCLIFLGLSTAANAYLWQSSALNELTGSRNSSTTSGIDATAAWDNGGLEISWDITEDQGLWTYQYTVNVDRKDVSHFILEVTDDQNAFAIFDGTDTEIEGPGVWTQDSGNPLLPNDFYGIKFDFGGETATYTIVTDRAPVYGVFYAKDGKDGGDQVAAWATALNYSDFRTNEDLTETDFIVRPNGEVPSVPIPGSALLLVSGFAVLGGFKQKFKN